MAASSAPGDHGMKGHPAQMAIWSFSRRSVYDYLCPPSAQPGPWDHQERHRRSSSPEPGATVRAAERWKVRPTSARNKRLYLVPYPEGMGSPVEGFRYCSDMVQSVSDRLH